MTGYLATICSMPLARYDAALARVAAAQAAGDTPDLPQILGVHLEGPFLGGAPGAHPVSMLRAMDAAWLGGLLEHVLSLCHLSRFTAQHYRVDLDLLLAGAVLHDLGKIYELSYDRSFGYSAEGQLLGHMVIGLRIVSDKLRFIPDFPPQLRTLLEHMIVSHHGKLEFGSPKYFG